MAPDIYNADAAFLDNYGWCEILGESGPIAGGPIACGLLLLGPATLYPRHRHEAEEIYLPLHGTAAWQQGDAVWRDRAPGTLIHHAGDEPHAMRTGAGPMQAVQRVVARHLETDDGMAGAEAVPCCRAEAGRGEGDIRVSRD